MVGGSGGQLRQIPGDGDRRGPRADVCAGGLVPVGRRGAVLNPPRRVAPVGIDPARDRGAVAVRAFGIAVARTGVDGGAPDAGCALTTAPEIEPTPVGPS